MIRRVFHNQYIEHWLWTTLRAYLNTYGLAKDNVWEGFIHVESHVKCPIIIVHRNFI